MRYKFILQSVVMLVFSFSMILANIEFVYAEDLTPYTLVDSLEQEETNWHYVYGVIENDTVLIDILPENTSVLYESDMYDPDMGSVSYEYRSGGHSHMFIAEKTGDYLLKLHSYYYVGNYSVKSSHRLTPEGGAPDFRVESSQSILEIEKGSSADATITVYSESGFNSPVSLAVTNTPPNVNVLFSSAIVTPPPDGEVNSTLTVEVDSSATAGTYVLNVTGESDILTHWCEIDLVIKNMGAYLEISLSQSVIVYESSVNISGSISPPIADVEIQLEFRIDGSQWSLLQNVTTDSYGEFALSNWKPAKAGSYEIRAYWSGSQEFGETRSQIQTLLVEKASSSIYCSLAPSQITYEENVTISANLDVPLSTGIVILQWTSNNISWNDIVLHAPSQGLYTHYWTPDAGLYSIRAKWTGGTNYLPSISSSCKLIVEKRSTELTTEISANIVNSGEPVSITVSTSPILSGESITIQVAKNREDWQNLISDITDFSGTFTYMWLPEDSRQFWIRSAWTGTKNYEGNISKPVLLIVEEGFPTISTQITDIFIPPNIELRENTHLSYNVTIAGAQNIIHSGNEPLDTSSLGIFDFYIIFLGNETYKSTFYKGEYTVNKIETEIVIDYIPKAIMVGHSAYVNYSVCEKKSSETLYSDSTKLDTSAVGSTYVDISYDGDEIHKPQSYRLTYDVAEPLPVDFYLKIVGVIVAAIGSILIPLYFSRRKKREKQLKENHTRQSTKKTKSIKNDNQKA
jgi:hypothetical protein